MAVTIRGDGTIDGFAMNEWEQGTNLPLTSLSGITTYSGTWSISGTLQVVVPGSTQCRAFSTVPIAESGTHIVEVEMQVPSSFSGVDAHVRMGWHSSNSGGHVNFGIRGDGKVYWERDSSAVLRAAVSYTIPAAGTWVKLRLKWNVQWGRFDGYIDGVLVDSYSSAEGNATDLLPYIVTYNNGGSPTQKFRNFKAWSLVPTTNLIPADPA